MSLAQGDERRLRILDRSSTFVRRRPAPDVAGEHIVGPVTDDGESLCSSPGLSRVLVVVGVAIGLGLRIVLTVATSSFGRPDSDEVIAGLMARHIRDDGYPWFFWGQHYGGTPQLALDAASLEMFGTSVVAMRLPTLVLGALCSVLVWRVALRLLSRRGAQVAGLLSWIAFPPALFFSTRDHLFYVPVVLFGLLAALCALRIRDMGHSAMDWLGLVIALVLGMWCMPTIVYFAIPAVVVVGRAPVARLLREWREGAVGSVAKVGVAGVTGAVLLVVAGAWLWLTRAAPPTWREARLDYLGNLAFFFTDGLPGLLGFREIFTYRWIWGPVGVLSYLAVMAVMTSGLVASVHRRAWDAAGLVVLPFIFALFPQATDQPNMRYLFFAVPFIAIVAARATQHRRTAGYVALGLALVLTFTSLHRLYVVSEVDRSTRVGLVGDVDQAIAVLDAEGISAGYANYWIAYRMTFESGGRTIVTPPFREDRYPPYGSLVSQRSPTAWIVGRGGQLDALRMSLRSLGVEARERDAGDFVVVVPARDVRPEELSGPVRHTI